MKYLITGGAGFIGSALIRELIANHNCSVFNLDKLTYAGNLSSLRDIKFATNYEFKKGCITNKKLVKEIIFDFQPDVVMNLAAESHVDRSIEEPQLFINTNIIGTFNLLKVSNDYVSKLSQTKKKSFKFHHISTDEVFGSLHVGEIPFNETSPYKPNSPYSASKAASDHLVRAWSNTYGLNYILTNCSNNYGPYQFPEKFIPHIIISALSNNVIPIYGNGLQIRDWLYVEDHVDALIKISKICNKNTTYNIGGKNQITNLDVANIICEYLDKVAIGYLKSGKSFKGLIKHVNDRPGHDKRYDIDSAKIERELNWYPKQDFFTGIKKTVDWYLNNKEWWEEILTKKYQLKRLGRLK